MENIVINRRYRFLQAIGTGGFGHTYVAEDLHLPTRPKVVVKHLKPLNNDRETYALAHKLFQQEAEILYRLGNHPFIPRLLAHFSENGEFFLVQEFIEGCTIAQEFACGKRYNEKEIIQLLGQTLETLAYVHNQKVIHRDVKPANLIRRQSDANVFLIDFGAVKQVNSFPPNQNASGFSALTIGSHGYMPLEQLAGSPNYASDLYALGMVAVEALTGVKPAELKKNKNTGEYIWNQKASFSPEIEHFISKLIRFDYRRRFQTAVEALAYLGMHADRIGFFANKKRSSIQASASVSNNINAGFPAVHPSLLDQTVESNPTNELSFKSNAEENIPPTLIVPDRQQGKFVGREITLQPVNSVQREKKYFANNPQNDFSGKLSDYKYGIIFFVFLFLLGGLIYSANGLIKTSQPQMIAENASQNEKKSAKPLKENVSNQSRAGVYSLYDEAEKQGAEAQMLETKATTKFEWEEIGKKYKRAYALLASIEATSAEYTKARAKMNFFKQKADSAFEKISNAKETPGLNGGSSNN